MKRKIPDAVIVAARHRCQNSGQRVVSCRRCPMLMINDLCSTTARNAARRILAKYRVRLPRAKAARGETK